MATTTVAYGKIQVEHGRGHAQLPPGWICDRDGNASRTTTDALFGAGGGLLPLGGVEATGGYKGYGLSMMVEMLCGILAGAAWGPHVRTYMHEEKSANLVA
jgi:LDH2 family malate/lactate/ureidoglycolate dehydrogenase